MSHVKPKRNLRNAVCGVRYAVGIIALIVCCFMSFNHLHATYPNDIFVDITPFDGDTLQNKKVIDFNIHPNPASDYFEINLLDYELTSEFVTVQIFDAQGLLVKKIQLYDRKTQIDVSNFPKGFYIVKIDKEAKKLIVK
jgi:hypothetical protein